MKAPRDMECDGMTLKIERGIPAPRAKGRYWPLVAEMKVGDSILFPGGAKRSAYNAVHFANKVKKERKYICRCVDDGYRIWRIK
jgi:hypothetical protein